MTHITNRSWTEEEIARLRTLSDAGATIVRAAAALNRKTEAVRKVARKHCIPLVGVKQSRVAMRGLDPG